MVSFCMRRETLGMKRKSGPLPLFTMQPSGRLGLAPHGEPLI